MIFSRKMMIFFFFTLKYCLLLRNQFLECHFWKSLDNPRIEPSLETCEKIAKVLNSKHWMRVILVWMCLKMAWLDTDSFYWKKKWIFIIQFSFEKRLDDRYIWLAAFNYIQFNSECIGIRLNCCKLKEFLKKNCSIEF